MSAVRVRSVIIVVDADAEDVVVTAGFNPRLLTSEITGNNIQ